MSYSRSYKVISQVLSPELSDSQIMVVSSYISYKRQLEHTAAAAEDKRLEMIKIRLFTGMKFSPLVIKEQYTPPLL